MDGILLEKLVVAHLAMKCDIKRDAVYEHQYKLDFIIDRFREFVSKLQHVGVQITCYTDPSGVRDFLRMAEKRKGLTRRNAYVVIPPELGRQAVDNWASELVYNALVAFLFSKELKDVYEIGIRILADMTYEFFDLVAGQNRQVHKSNGNGAPHREPGELAQGTGSKLRGKIVRFLEGGDKNFGFIRQAGSQKEFFFHKDMLTDPMVIRFLENRIRIANPQNGQLARPVYVQFEDGGGAEDSQCPRAVNIVFSDHR